MEGNARRKPPVPAAGHTDVESWFGRLVPHLQPIVREFEETIRTVISDLDFAVKYKWVFYGVPALGWTIEIAPYDVSVNALFLGGARFDRPPPLGTSDPIRYVKISSQHEVARSDLTDWIRQAGRTPGWRWRRLRQLSG